MPVEGFTKAQVNVRSENAIFRKVNLRLQRYVKDSEEILRFVHDITDTYTTFLLNLLFSLCLCCFLASFLFFFHARLFSPLCS